MDWNDVRYFLAVVRSGSLTSASEQLRVSQSTVSRRIDALESRLNIILFARHQTGYFVTDEGQSLVSHAEAVEAAALGLESFSAGTSRNVVGTVRLTTAENLASHIIIPALPRFRERHPDVRMEIVTGIASVSLSRREADLALRLTRPEHGNITIRRLGELAYALYASKTYLSANRRPQDGGRFVGYAFVGWDDSLSHLPMAQWLTQAMEGTSPVVTASSLQGHLAAACAGLGLALLPCFLADAEPELIRLVEPGDAFSQEIWLAIHGDLAASARVRVVAEFLATLINDHQNQLMGHVGRK
jgi:DNA-binding transcriptional LysR family regulator